MSAYDTSALVRFLLTLSDDEQREIVRALSFEIQSKEPYRVSHLVDDDVRSEAKSKCEAIPENVRSVVFERLCTVLQEKKRPEFGGGMSPITMWRWRHAYGDYGVQGLIPKKSTGRPRKA